MNIHYESKIHTGHITLLCDHSKSCGCKRHILPRSFNNSKFHFQLQLFPDHCLQVLNMRREIAFCSLPTRLSCRKPCSIFSYRARVHLYICRKHKMAKFVPCQGLKKLCPSDFLRLPSFLAFARN